jgi:catechol 2,3-dioxygenase-like lactoylglutathione lyase family enzyme
MSTTLGALSLLVHDYDEAIAWYTAALDFCVWEDSPREAGKRWVMLGPPSGQGTGLLMARAGNAEQLATVGRQGGGRVWLFLHTSDFDADHARMVALGVRFMEAPRREPYGSVAVFEDLYGNRWDLLQAPP